METINIILSIVAMCSLLVSYSVYKSAKTPEIIIYAEPNPYIPTVINLVIENIGNSKAYNVTFNSNQKVPFEAFGISQLTDPLTYFETGVFIYGINVFNPKQRYIYEWGQYGGLYEALKNGKIEITAKYKHKHPLNIWKSTLTNHSVIHIKELDMLTYNHEKIIIGKELQNINKNLSNIFKKLSK